MKKILTLLVVFLATWNVLCAQMPVFGYQAVVRTADNELVENTAVGVTITVLNGDSEVYAETHENVETDGLGMISLLVGTGTHVDGTGSIEDVDWTNAKIRTDLTIDGGELVSITSEVYAAPYAAQALETVLTTDRIVQYVQDPETTVDDYAECMDSLNVNIPENGQMWMKTRNRIINYIMNHRDIALEVAVAYLESADENDVNEVYSHLTPEAKAEAIEVGTEFLVNHRGFVLEVLTEYVENSTPAEVDDLIDAVLTHETDILPYVVEFAKNNRNLALRLANAVLASATAQEVTNALGVFNNSPMKQKFVDEFFYNHLDNILHPTNTLTEQEIKDRVDQKLGDGYLKKTKCGGQDVDICNMRDSVREMMED